MTDSIKGLDQAYERCIQTRVLFSAFRLDLPRHEDRVLAFSLVFLCFRRDEPVQQDASQDFACNGEQLSLIHI